MAVVTKPRKKAKIDPDLEDLVFKALANRDRRSMIDYVSSQARTTGEICHALLHLDRCTVMLHLSVLEKAGLLITKKQGRTKLHYLNVVPIQTIYDRWMQPYARPAARILTQLAKDLR